MQATTGDAARDVISADDASDAQDVARPETSGSRAEGRVFVLVTLAAQSQAGSTDAAPVGSGVDRPAESLFGSY